MAETRKTVRALIFESTAKSGALMKTEMKIQGKIIPKELKFFDTVTRIRRDSDEFERKFTKVSNHHRFNFMTSSERVKPSVRMLVYEDSSDEEDDADKLRATPPNPQERQAATPGAPIKSRKEFDKKILRPKKLVYYSDRENEENYFYATPTKKSGRNEEDNVYKNFTEIITMPRKILHLPTDEELYSNSTNRQIISTTSQGGRKKSRNRNGLDGTRRTGKSKNGTTTDDKENDATVIGTEYNRDVRQASDSHKSRSLLKNHDRDGACTGQSREEFANLSKLGEFTHFRI